MYLCPSGDLQTHTHSSSSATCSPVKLIQNNKLYGKAKAKLVLSNKLTEFRLKQMTHLDNNENLFLGQVKINEYQQEVSLHVSGPHIEFLYRYNSIRSSFVLPTESSVFNAGPAGQCYSAFIEYFSRSGFVWGALRVNVDLDMMKTAGVVLQFAG